MFSQSFFNYFAGGEFIWCNVLTILFLFYFYFFCGGGGGGGEGGGLSVD